MLFLDASDVYTLTHKLIYFFLDFHFNVKIHFCDNILIVCKKYLLLKAHEKSKYPVSEILIGGTQRKNWFYKSFQKTLQFSQISCTKYSNSMASQHENKFCKNYEASIFLEYSKTDKFLMILIVKIIRLNYRIHPIQIIFSS